MSIFYFPPHSHPTILQINKISLFLKKGNNLADIPTTLVETGGHILKSRFSKYTYY